jgi:hypothetical protein
MLITREDNHYTIKFTLHFTLGVDNDTSVILKVEENTVSTAPGLTLTDDNSSHNLLSQLGLTLLDGSDNHVTTTSSGKSVQTTLDVTNSNNVQVLGTRVIGTIHDGTNGQTESHTVLGSGNAN